MNNPSLHNQSVQEKPSFLGQEVTSSNLPELDLATRNKLLQTSSKSEEILKSYTVTEDKGRNTLTLKGVSNRLGNVTVTVPLSGPGALSPQDIKEQLTEFDKKLNEIGGSIKSLELTSGKIEQETKYSSFSKNITVRYVTPNGTSRANEHSFTEERIKDFSKITFGYAFADEIAYEVRSELKRKELSRQGIDFQKYALLLQHKENQGTGIPIYRRDGFLYVATNGHIVHPLTPGKTIEGTHFGKKVSGKVFLIDKDDDIAVVRFPEKAFPELEIPQIPRNNEKPKPGTEAYAIGYSSFGEKDGKAAFQLNDVMIIRNLPYEVGEPNDIKSSGYQIMAQSVYTKDAEGVTPGMSGGPLYTLNRINGKLVPVLVGMNGLNTVSHLLNSPGEFAVNGGKKVIQEEFPPASLHIPVSKVIALIPPGSPRQTPMNTSYPGLTKIENGVFPRGTHVKSIQSQLNQHGFSIKTDGVFGPKTQAAIIGFQGKKGLIVDGIVGPQTWRALFLK